MSRRERRVRTLLIDYRHPKLGRRTARIRASTVAYAVRAFHRRRRPRFVRPYPILGIREP